MASAAFEELVEDFEFLDDWEERYRAWKSDGTTGRGFESACHQG